MTVLEMISFLVRTHHFDREHCTGTDVIIIFNHEFEVFNLCYSPRTMLMPKVMQDHGKQQTLNPENLWLKFILIHSKSTCGPFFCSFSTIFSITFLVLILEMTGNRVPTEIQKHNSMIFP